MPEPKMNPSPNVLNCQVIVVNYNAGGLLADCVESALEAGASRVTVVDNASADNSIDELLNRYGGSDRLAVIRNPENEGFAVACNIGARASDAPALLFLNPDSVLEMAALGRMLDVLNSSPAIGVVGGFLCNPDGTEQAGGRRVFPTPRRAFMRAFGLSRYAKKFPSMFSDFQLYMEELPAAPAPVEAISGACMLVKREAIESVGLWDEGYFLHCEDLDWCMRFRMNGWKIMFVPDARVTHTLGVCSASRPVFVEWHKHKGMMRFYHKFFRHQYPGVLMGLVALGVWLRFGLVAAYYTARRVGRVLGVGQ